MTLHPLPDGLLEISSDGSPRLTGGYSPTSGRHHFPRSELCPYTGADDVIGVTLPTTGRLWLWTAVTAALPGTAVRFRTGSAWSNSTTSDCG